MLDSWPIQSEIRNFVFIGEAGCGKSELGINLAVYLSTLASHSVHFFDLDMTKPLFRSRDVASLLEQKGITFHYEEQFMDAPTLTGGVRVQMKDPNAYCVLDVGGDDIGARAIGGYAPLLNAKETVVYYVVNSFRPWSATIEHIDGILSKILGVSHIQLEHLHFIANPNLGKDSSVKEIEQGLADLTSMLEPYANIEFVCVMENYAKQVQTTLPIVSVKRYLAYEWEMS